MTEYLFKLLDLLSNISIDDIKKYLNTDNTDILDIWGNYDAFYESETNPQSDLSTFMFICNNEYSDIKYEEYNKIGINVYIIGKIGYYKFIKEYCKFIINFLNNRKDLNIFTRLYLSIIKGNNKIKRVKFQIEINKFCNNEINANKYIYKLFKDKNIDRLYLYKFNKKGTNIY